MNELAVTVSTEYRHEIFPALLASITVWLSLQAVNARDLLAESFANPPVAAKPAIWWFWGESVTTDHGITQDLEALKRVGFGGVVIYEQMFTDRPDALRSLSPEWLARLRFAATECARLGMVLEVNVSDGYVAGGPWITPALGMQRLVASETTVVGGHPVSISLPQPPAKLDYYRDVAVLAYPSPAGGGEDALPKPICTSDPPGIDLDQLFSLDGRAKARIHPPAAGRPVLVQLDYGRPCTARSLTYSVRFNSKALVIATQMPASWADDFYGQNMRLNPPIGHLEASDDGREWRPVCGLPGPVTCRIIGRNRQLRFPPRLLVISGSISTVGDTITRRTMTIWPLAALNCAARRALINGKEIGQRR